MGITVKETLNVCLGIFLFALLALIAPASASAQYGKFVGEIVAKWKPDGRTMVLTAPFAYIDPAGGTWDALSGAEIDGASIPKLAWSLIGGPFEGKYRAASVIHDVACTLKQRPWELVHLTFYYAMRASGVEASLAAKMYGAVYYFGPRWGFMVKTEVPGENVEQYMKKTMGKFDSESRFDISVSPADPPTVQQKASNCPPVCSPSDLGLTDGRPSITKMSVNVTPPDRQLGEADFSNLQSFIDREALSLSEEALLAEIRNFRARKIL
jgi:Protein of unknown function (DUF1353)